MANVIQYNYVSRDAQTLLEEFRAEFNGAFMQDPGEQWALELGLEIITNALKVTLPVPISAAGYVERKGDRVYRRLAERSFSFSPRIWQDGFAEFAEIVEAPEFLGWQQEPASMAAAAAQMTNELVSARIEANPTGWDEKALFATDHPVHVINTSAGSFSNLITGAGTNFTAANVGVARSNFRKIKGPNKKPLGVRFLGVLIPPALEEKAIEIRDSALVVLTAGNGAVDNIYKGLKFWVSDQLTSDIKWYPIGVKTGMYPWAIVNRGTPENKVLGKDSALFEREEKVGFHSTLQRDAAMGFPQLIQSWAGTAP